METPTIDIEKLESGLKGCSKLLTALGDETRQHLLGIMLNENCWGCRAIEIADRSHLSRPAVSHHMQVLKNAGIVNSRKEGTFIYYYLDPSSEEVDKALSLFKYIKEIMGLLPDRSGQDD